MKQISKAWLDRAKDDLDVISEIIGNNHLTNMVAFHAQQAVEKLYKSIIEEYDIDFIKTHKLEILNESVKKCLRFDVDIEIIKKLDEVYISSRYPSDLGLLPYGKPATEDAKTFSEYALKMYKNVSKLMGGTPPS